MGEMSSTLELLRQLLQEETASPAVADQLESPDRFSTVLHGLYHNNPDVNPQTCARLRLIDQLNVLANRDVSLLRLLAGKTRPSTSLADVATDLYEITDSQLSADQVTQYQSRLFSAEPTAVLRGLVKRNVIPTPSPAVKAGLVQLFDTAIADDFDISRTSARALLMRFQGQRNDAISTKDRSITIETFRAIQRLQAVVTKPEEIGPLIQAKLTSAQLIAAKDRDAVTRQLMNTLPVQSVHRIHDHASIIDARNEQAWVQLLKTRSRDLIPAGVPSSSAASGTGTTSTAVTKLNDQTPTEGSDVQSGSTAPATKQKISLESLFHEVDTASCEHCCSVISPSAYFVDLLRMLEKLTLSDGTTLMTKLFERRGDLGGLELSCSNTNNLIPYIDLVHEVLQSFAVSLIGTADAEVLTTNLSVSIPTQQQQHRTDLADEEREIAFDHRLHMHWIRKQVFPLHVFPYNFASDSIERFLQAAGTSRLEIAQTFAKKSAKISGARAPETRRRALTAYRLGLTAEEYVLLTGESIFSKRSLQVDLGALSWEAYHQAIGLVPVFQQWGYERESDMYDTNEKAQLGLTFVREQLLPRSGLDFRELVEILKTQFLGCRLVLTSANCAPTFTGKMDDFRLRSSAMNPDAVGSLTEQLCGDLIVFVRLRKRLNWSISDLDAAISGLHRTNPSLGHHASIHPDTLESLAAIQTLKGLTGCKVPALMPLWSDIDISGNNSLYANLFLQGKGGSGDSHLFAPDDNGRYFTQAARLSEAAPVLIPLLAITASDFQELISLCGDPWLSLASVSQLYRYWQLGRIFEVPIRQLRAFLQLQPSPLDEDPHGTLAALQKWKKWTNGELSPSDVVSLCTGAGQDASNDPLEQLRPQTIALLQPSTARAPYLLAAENEVSDCPGDIINVLFKDLLTTSLDDSSSTSIADALQSAYKRSYRSAYFTPTGTGKFVFSLPLPISAAPKFTINGAVKPPMKSGDGSEWHFLVDELQSGQTCIIEASENLALFRCMSSQSSALPLLMDCLVPSDVAQEFTKAVKVLKVAAQFLMAFDIDSEELLYLSQSGSFNVSHPDLTGIANLDDYVSLRTALSLRGIERHGLLQYLRWTQTGAITRNALIGQLARLTGSTVTLIDGVVEAMYPAAITDDVGLADFKDLNILQQFTQILVFCSRETLQNSDPNLFFELAEPPHPLEQDQEFKLSADLRAEMQKVLSTPVKDKRTGYGLVLDSVIEKCRDALIQFLLNHKYFKSRSLQDADALFEHFLIDVRMGSGLKTSRMKQAISVIQLYVQRCQLGLELSHGVPSDLIKVDEWAWMRSYPIWEAHRKVFLYPENWVDPTLRDDKSDLFKELEAKIMQSNLDQETLDQIVKSYVYGVNELSDLAVQAYLWDTQVKGSKIFHLFAKTRNAPYIFYYRKLDIVEANAHDKVFYWSPWQKVDLEIPTFEVDAAGKALQRTGSYLLPTIRRGRVYLFIPQIMLKTAPSDSLQTPSTGNPPSNTTKYWEVRMGWTELRNGQWAAKRVSQAFLNVLPILTPAVSAAAVDTKKKDDDILKCLDASCLPQIHSFKFCISSSTASGAPVTTAQGVEDIINIDMECWLMSDANKGLIDRASSTYNTVRRALGRFQMREYDITAMPTSKMPDEYQSETKKTLPTWFGKLEWDYSTTTEDGKNSWKPENVVYHRGSETKPLLAKVLLDSKSTRRTTWTISFDDAQATEPTGLLVDTITQEHGNRSFLVLPALSVVETKDGSGVVHSMNNKLAPFFMERATSVDGLDMLYDGIANDVDGTEWSDAFGLRTAPCYHELAKPYSLYNWELGFHIVSLLLERLFATQQLELALKVAKYVFDPAIPGTAAGRCWRFPPFTVPEIADSQGPAALVDTLDQTKLSNLDLAVQEWRARPFVAHAMARSWPVAYMKRIVRKYIEILVASGDEYFRQGTLESMPLAIQRYVEASHLFGARPRTFPPLSKSAPRSFNDLTGKFNSFSNTTVDLELDFPFAREPDWRGYSAAAATRQRTGKQSGLLGFVRTGYFCVPANPDLVALRDLIDDRLYKIRNCQDISGRGVTLRLFEPALDPGALVQAAAAGISVSSFLAEAQSVMPNYRFQYLLLKAFELCGELKSMGEQFLAIKEKKDAEALSALRSSQELAINTMTLDIKKLQRTEASKLLENLEETRQTHAMRLNFYQRLIGEEEQTPAPGQEWQDIQQNIDEPTMDDLRMSHHEKLEFNLAAEAAAISLSASTLETVASGLLALPKIQENIDPMGMGVSIQFDASNVAHYMMGTSSVMKLASQLKGDQSSRAARKAQLIRQLQERRLQANMAGRDIVQVDKQIAAANARLHIAESEIQLQEKQIKNTKEMDLWCRAKYTNEKLYAWMDSSFHKIYQETYIMAADLARKAQKAYDFECGRGRSSFLRDSGYWDKSRDGLLSAQNLYLDLKRMEISYMSARFHDFELSKTISLRQIDPLALLKLRAKGETTFSLSELLFDLDFPGHYLRRLKSVSISIPCVVGPYTGINCTLELTKQMYRVQPQLPDGESYNRGEADGQVLQVDQVPVRAIAVSGGSNETGVFELNFNGERYLPFEGAGAISSWKLQLPTVQQFDYNTISDVLMHVRYTAADGPTSFKTAVNLAVEKCLATVQNSTLYALFDIQNDYSSEWHALNRAVEDENAKKTPALLQLKDMKARLPYWTKALKPVATLTSLLVSYTGSSCPQISWASSDTPFTTTETWKDYTLLQNSCSKEVGNWSLVVPRNADGKIEVSRLFVVVEYKLEKRGSVGNKRT